MTYYGGVPFGFKLKFVEEESASMTCTIFISPVIQNGNPVMPAISSAYQTIRTIQLQSITVALCVLTNKKKKKGARLLLP